MSCTKKDNCAYFPLINMWPFKKKEKEQKKLNLADVQPELITTYVIQWNFNEDISDSEELFAADVPFCFNGRAAVAIQADVEFLSNGTYHVGRKTQLFLQGSPHPIIIDVPFNEFKKHWQEIQTNIIINDQLSRR
jgi:hypothetical protein